MIGSHVIYGPFKFECSNGDCEYNVKAYDANGSQIHVGIYDSDGNSMTLDGYKKRSFYIRLSKENASRGVSRVTLEAKRTVTKMVSSYKKVKAWYVWKGATDSHGEPQPLYSDPISVSDVSRETSNSTHSINWEGCLPTGLVIDKYDQENPSKKLAGVKFRVSCKNPYYDQIWETDSDGHIEIYDLPIGNYKVEEVETIYKS